MILLVGGSTLYGPEVPDDYTLASQLSKRLNSLDPAHRYVIYNAGVVAADSAQDRDRVAYELSRGLKPYMIVAVDGHPVQGWADVEGAIRRARRGDRLQLRVKRGGADLYAVQRLLGHSSPLMTQRYAHLQPDDLRLAVEKVATCA